MTVLKAKWLPEGTVVLPEIPVLGMRELKDLEAKDAEIQSLYSHYNFLKIGSAILAAERIQATLGVAKAKQSWDEYVVAEFDGLALFLWPLETFTESLKGTKEKFLYQNLGCIDDAEAKLRLEAEGKKLNEKFGAIDKAAVQRISERPLLSLYWRLRASGLKTILNPTGAVTIDWSLDKKQVVIDLLSEVVTRTELDSLNEKSDRAPSLEDLKPLETADVLGKSRKPSAASTESSPSSEPSSTLSTAIIAA